MYISFDNLFGYFYVVPQSHSPLCSFRNTIKLSQKSKSKLSNLLLNHYLCAKIEAENIRKSFSLRYLFGDGASASGRHLAGSHEHCAPIRQRTQWSG